MTCWMRIGLVALSLVLSALPLEAQGLSPFEAVYCPASEPERERQCRQADTTIRRNRNLMTSVGAQMSDPMIILVRVERAPGESVGIYRARVKQQQGVASATTNRWLPVVGRYYDPDRQVVYVALARQDYWRYVWEKLTPDEALARRTFLQREKESRQVKQARYLGPGGLLAQWQREIETAQRFQQACCLVPPETPPDRALFPPREQERP